MGEFSSLVLIKYLHHVQLNAPKNAINREIARIVAHLAVDGESQRLLRKQRIKSLINLSKQLVNPEDNSILAHSSAYPRS